MAKKSNVVDVNEVFRSALQKSLERALVETAITVLGYNPQIGVTTERGKDHVERVLERARTIGKRRALSATKAASISRKRAAAARRRWRKAKRRSALKKAA